MILLKREISTINTGILNTRYCELLQKGEELPADEISIAEAREILWIEDELHVRVIRAVGHDFYPPDRVESRPTIKSMIGPKRETETKPGEKIKFKVTVTSSIGSKAAEFSVNADTKEKADLLARKEIRKLGLSGASHKIS